MNCLSDDAQNEILNYLAMPRHLFSMWSLLKGTHQEIPCALVNIPRLTLFACSRNSRSTHPLAAAHLRQIGVFVVHDFDTTSVSVAKQLGLVKEQLKMRTSTRNFIIATRVGTQKRNKVLPDHGIHATAIKRSKSAYQFWKYRHLKKSCTLTELLPAILLDRA